MNPLETIFDEKELVWSGVDQPLINDFNCSLGETIYTNLKKFPNKVCQVFDVDGREVTNDEMLSWSIRLAKYFKKLGLRYDDVIGVVAKNSTYTSAVAIGCLLNCTPFHAVNGGLDQKFKRALAFAPFSDTIQLHFENTAPKVIFCDGDVYEKIHAATRSLKTIFYTLTDHIDGVATVEDLLQPTPNENLYLPEPLTLGGEQTVAILCSSGTTGLPKCVCTSNYSWQLFDIFGSQFVTSDDVIFSTSGLDWVTGTVFTVLPSISSCKRIITNKPYTPEYVIELIQKYNITVLCFAPRHIATLVSCSEATVNSLSSVRMCLVGGGSVSLPTIKRLQSILRKDSVHFLYGLTEAGFVSMNIGIQCPGSVGKLSPRIKVRIVDELGQNLPPNEIGEIYVKTGLTWNGYYGNQTETQRMQDSLGWFHTGDLGYIDDKNLLYIVDRKKDIIKYQGMQYWPMEIEEVINELTEVEDTCVVGVYDERNGDAAGAVVVRRKGAQLTEQKVKEHVSKRLPAYYKQLHAGVVFVDHLPQSVNGKTLRREAKTLFEVK